MLTEEQIRGTLRDLAGQKVMQAFVHPRPGLMTPYLSDEWFRLWKIALDEAEKLDMNIWIYDENSYPSGFAGGHVPEVMPESRGRGLVFREEKQAPESGDDTVAVYRVVDRCGGRRHRPGFAAVNRCREGNTWWLRSVRARELALARQSLLRRPDVSRRHGKVPGSDAGSLQAACRRPVRQTRIWVRSPTSRMSGPPAGCPGPTICRPPSDNAGATTCWTLPSLLRPVGNWKQVRHDYFQVVLEQFIEHWAKPYYVVRRERSRVHRSLLGPRMAALRRA